MSHKSWRDGDPSAPRTYWGPAQDAYDIAYGVRLFMTAGHGGLAVSPGVAKKMLSGAARRFAAYSNGVYWFEEDVAIFIPLYEVEAWRESHNKIFHTYLTPEKLESYIHKYYPNYFHLRESGHEEMTPPKKGDKLQFLQPYSYANGQYTFEVGDQVAVDKVTGNNVLFVSPKYGFRFWIGMSKVLDGVLGKVPSRLAHSGCDDNGRMLDYGEVKSDSEEGRMARSALKFIAEDAIELYRALKDADDLPSWCEYSLAEAQHIMQTLKRYMTYEIENPEHPHGENPPSMDKFAGFRYIPPYLRHLEPETPPGTNLTVYKTEAPDDAGRYYLMIFSGKQSDPVVNNYSTSLSAIHKTLDWWIKANKSSLEAKMKRRQERLDFKHSLNVGSILVSSWGYDQTNVDFYEVIQVLDKQVIIREIGKKVSHSDRGADYVVPTPGHYVGPPMRKKVGQGNSVSISSSQSASEWNGKPKYQTAWGWGH